MSQTTHPVSSANPPRIEFASTLPALLAATVRAHADRPFLIRRSAKGGDPVTFGAFADEVRAIAKTHLDEIDAKIEALSEMRATLAHLVDSCAGNDRPDCPILASLADGPT